MLTHLFFWLVLDVLRLLFAAGGIPVSHFNVGHPDHCRRVRVSESEWEQELQSTPSHSLDETTNILFGSQVFGLMLVALTQVA